MTVTAAVGCAGWPRPPACAPPSPRSTRRTRADPTIVTVRERTGPKEIVHADLVTEWVLRLKPDADDALLLAARGHHFRRWTVPRDELPGGPRRATCAGARTCTTQQARELGVVLGDAGYDDGDDRARAVARAQGRAWRVRPSTTTSRCSRTRCASCSSRRSSSTSRPGSIPATLPGVITKTAREDEPGRARPRSPTCRSARARTASSTRPSRATSSALPRRDGRGRLGRARGDARARRRAHRPVPRRLPRSRASTRGSSRRRSSSLSGYALVVVDMIADGQPRRGRAERDRRRRRRAPAHRRDRRVRRRAAAHRSASPCTCRRPERRRARSPA